MHIGVLGSGCWKRFEELAERSPRNIREGSGKRLALNAVMTEGACIQLAVPREVSWIKDGVVHCMVGVGPLPGVFGDVGSPSTVAGFAGYSGHEGGWLEAIGCRVVRERLDETGMTFHAGWVDGT